MSGALRLAEVRGRVAEVLAPATDEDPAVLMDIVDALSPPAILLLWTDPWLEAKTVGARNGSGYWDARLEVLCVASRIEPGPGMTKLEELVGYVIARFQADAYSWPPEALYAPRRFDIGNIPYLGARLTFRVPVTV